MKNTAWEFVIKTIVVFLLTLIIFKTGMDYGRTQGCLQENQDINVDLGNRNPPVRSVTVGCPVPYYELLK